MTGQTRRRCRWVLCAWRKPGSRDRSTKCGPGGGARSPAGSVRGGVPGSPALGAPTERQPARAPEALSGWHLWVEGPSVITHLSSTQRCARRWTRKVSSCPPMSPRPPWGTADPRQHRAKRQALCRPWGVRGEHANTSGMQHADTRGVTAADGIAPGRLRGGARGRHVRPSAHTGYLRHVTDPTVVFSKCSIRGFSLNATDPVSHRLTLKVVVPSHVGHRSSPVSFRAHKKLKITNPKSLPTARGPNEFKIYSQGPLPLKAH